jgi:hypothetical protein
MGSISSANSYLQPLITLQNTGLTNTSSVRVAESSLGLKTDSPEISPLAQMMTTLQRLQQTDLAKYKEVTGQIATNLQKAAQSAQSDGNTTAAAALNQLASDFQDASQTGQMPNLKNLATAHTGHHGHHHAHGGASQPQDQLLAAFQAAVTSPEPSAVR